MGWEFPEWDWDEACTVSEWTEQWKCALTLSVLLEFTMEDWWVRLTMSFIKISGIQSHCTTQPAYLQLSVFPHPILPDLAGSVLLTVYDSLAVFLTIPHVRKILSYLSSPPTSLSMALSSCSHISTICRVSIPLSPSWVVQCAGQVHLATHLFSSTRILSEFCYVSGAKGNTGVQIPLRINISGPKR